MASRKDLLKAQSFITQRLVSSFVDRDPDNATGPLRRVGTATFVGVMIGVVLVAGSAILGKLGIDMNNTWQKPEGALVADASSGLLFIYYETETNGSDKNGTKRLLPMADVASARLAVGTSTTTTVKTDKLQGIQQDVIRGIPYAPRQLPPTSQMNPYPFRVCVTAPEEDTTDRYITVQVGKENTTRPTRTGDDQWLLVQADNNIGQFLVANGRYHHVPNSSLLNTAVPSVRTGNGWLSALPEGLPIEPLPIENPGGTPSKRPQADLVNGSVVMVEASAISPEPRYYIQVADGLAETSFVDMAVQLSVLGRSQPVIIPASEVSGNLSDTQPQLVTPGVPMEAPPQRPDQMPSEPSVCATYLNPKDNDNRSTPVITLNKPTPDLPTVVAERPPNYGYADYIDVDPLHGALLQDANTLGDSIKGPTFLLSGAQLYGIPDQRSRESLGYNASTPVLRVPGMLIKLIAPVQVELTRENIYPPLPGDLAVPE